MRSFLFGLALSGLVALCACKSNKAITIDVSPTSVQLSAGGQQMFTANVHHAHGNGGVTWALSSTSCSGAACGTLSGVSDNPVTYTAPASAPASNFNVTLTATSVADTSKSASATITILALSVSVSPTSANVTVSDTQTITATVASDPSNSGVNWTLTQSGVNCSPTCGSLSVNSSPSGAPITYTAPASVPTPATVTVTATAVVAPNPSANAMFTITTAAAACGTGSQSLLSGQYAFLAQGFDQNGPVAIAGTFTADGNGNVTAGEEDINKVAGPQVGLGISPSSSSASSYSVGSDNRGCLTLVNSAGTTTKFRFAVGSLGGTPSVASSGRIIEFDDAAGTGVPPLARSAGIIRKQDATSFGGLSTGAYAFGFSGNDSTGGRFAIAGVITTSGGGSFVNGNSDSDDAGTLGTNVGCTSCGTYSTTLDSNGRGSARLTLPIPTVTTVNFVFYQVSASEAIFLGMDNISPSDPIESGKALLETGAGSFSNSSFSGASVIHTEGFGGGGTNAPSVSIDLLTITSSGNFSLIEDLDQGGTSTNNSAGSGTYSVASNGRVTLPSGGGKNPPVLYLVNTNTAFLVGTGGAAELGFVEPQTGSNFSSTSLNDGNYFLGAENPSGSGVTMNSGTLTITNSTGSFSGTADTSGPGGLTHGQGISGNYSVTSNGTGTIGASGVLIVISSSKFLFIDESPGNTSPSVTVVEQ